MVKYYQTALHRRVVLKTHHLKKNGLTKIKSQLFLESYNWIDGDESPQRVDSPLMRGFLFKKETHKYYEKLN